MSNQTEVFDASRQPLTRTVKTITEWNHRAVNRADATQRTKEAHALASVFVMALWLIILVTVPVAMTYGVRGDLRMWAWDVFRVVTFRTDIEMIIFIFLLGGLGSFLIYKLFFYLSYITIYKDVVDDIQPVSETTTESTTHGDTSALNFSEGTNTSNTAIMNHGESVVELEERPENVGGMQFSSEMMAIIRRMAIHSNRVSRDRVWQPMKDAGLIEGSVVRHYQQSMKLFKHSSRKWVSGNKWTPNGYRSFLRVDSPLPSPEVMQNPDFVSDDDDDDGITG